MSGSLTAAAPFIDVLEQITSLPANTCVAVNHLGLNFTVVDADISSRSMTAWGTSSFLCDDFINLLTADFARYTLAGHSTAPATRACPYWISPCLPRIDGAAFSSLASAHSLASSHLFEGLLSSADDTQTIMALNVGNAHFLVGVANLTRSSIILYDSAPNMTSSLCRDISQKLSSLLSTVRSIRYPALPVRDWQIGAAEVEIQHHAENNCAIFSLWNVLAVTLHLRPCDNNLARALRRRWFPYLIWATGGSSLPLCARGASKAYSPSDSRVQRDLQRFYELATQEAQDTILDPITHLPDKFMESAWRSPKRDLSIIEMTHICELISSYLETHHLSTYMAPVDMLYSWSQSSLGKTLPFTKEVD